MNWPQKFFFSATFVLFILFLPSTLSAAYGELFHKDFSTSYSTVSFVFAIFLLILTILFIFVLWVLGVKNNWMRRHPLLAKLFKSLLNPFKEGKWYYTMLYQGYCARIGFMILMYFSFDSGIGHTILNILFSLLCLILLIWKRPFKWLASNILAITLEAFTFIYFFFLVSFLANPRKNYRIKKTWGVIIILLLILTAFIALFILIFSCGSALIDYYSWKFKIGQDAKEFAKKYKKPVSMNDTQEGLIDKDL